MKEILASPLAHALFYIFIITISYLVIDKYWLSIRRAKKELNNARWLERMVTRFLQCGNLNDYLELKSDLDKTKVKNTTNSYEFLAMLRKLEFRLKEKLDEFSKE